MNRLKIVPACLIAISLVILASFIPALAQEPERCIDTPCMALMSAFGAESTKMLNEMTDTKAYNVLGRTAVTGKIGDQDYVLGLSGVSMGNAAMMPQAWFDKFQISAAVFSEIAGGGLTPMFTSAMLLSRRSGAHIWNSTFVKRKAGPLAVKVI